MHGAQRFKPRPPALPLQQGVNSAATIGQAFSTARRVGSKSSRHLRLLTSVCAPSCCRAVGCEPRERWVSRVLATARRRLYNDDKCAIDLSSRVSQSR